MGKVDETLRKTFFEGKIVYKKDVGNNTILNITIPLGSWDILDAIVAKVLKYAKGDIVEVGMGESSIVLASRANEAGVSLYSCDLQMGGMFRVFDNPLFKNHFCYIERSEHFMEKYEGRPSVVFLDGEHKYETVKKEVDFFLSKMTPSGVMFLHDTLPKNEEQSVVDDEGISPGDVYRIRRDLELSEKVDCFTWPYSALSMGLTMVIKRNIRREYWLNETEKS